MRVRALKPMMYAMRDYVAGDEFETEDDMHGKLLIAAQSVEQVQQQPTAKRGQYRRRDMRADE